MAILLNIDTRRLERQFGDPVVEAVARAKVAQLERASAIATSAMIRVPCATPSVRSAMVLSPLATGGGTTGRPSTAFGVAMGAGGCARCCSAATSRHYSAPGAPRGRGVSVTVLHLIPPPLYTSTVI